MEMINYYIYAALARERSNFLQREAAAARRADQARLYRQRARASGARRSPFHRLFRRLRPAWASGGRAVLRDGSKVVIRQVQCDDTPLLADGFARLSPESRRLRFLRRKDELSAAELRYFTDIDHHDHEALGALDHPGGRGVGVARYVRDTGDPHAAEIAVTIVDDWQGRGLGTELLARLSGRARAAGIHRFTALVSADNQAAAGLLRGARGDVVRREHGTVEYEIPLAPCEEPCDALLIPLAG
ncbi:MAG TPA: GNAT family N-acetyltransferase [Streptosporangiaceae bacterium]|nr:GNAT family N-acetyltransferase [Streptosporangiaceae bacterium]